jgi:hypothetical protein
LFTIDELNEFFDYAAEIAKIAAQEDDFVEIDRD